ncbi:hypothetical protein PRCB_18355 [Pantoea rodasii]|uniref:Uncharacterized protein n=1 Tax=Pantoea rodasii TaxID=1076549 RepID=A0A2M9W9L0_9GAMM|nr:hypothetical protein PMI17_00460 [Pantoea sp. GM01]ORM63921.1 hypothetical protein HA45_12400 [Pantoea rodasii]PJZ04226.1 hypothetical protein PRCB_18355 [Pantoea rodasii]
MILKLTEVELVALVGRRFASTGDFAGASVTTILEVRIQNGRQLVVHELYGRQRKTPLTVFMLRFPYALS